MFLLPQGYLEVKDVPKMGRGVFASKDIAPGTVIGDYIGKIIRSRDDDKYDKQGHFFLMYYHDGASIYPNVRGLGIHVINHSCTPNVWMYTYKGHALYFAIRRIFKGEEITVSYLISEQDKECKPCNHLCFCKSMVCSGTMHLPKEKYEKWAKICENEEARTKRERVRYGEVLPHLSYYPKNIADNPFYTLFGNSKVKPQLVNVAKLPTVKNIRNMIRETGKTLKFLKLNLHVLGVNDGIVVSVPIS